MASRTFRISRRVYAGAYVDLSTSTSIDINSGVTSTSVRPCPHGEELSRAKFQVKIYAPNIVNVIDVPPPLQKGQPALQRPLEPLETNL